MPINLNCLVDKIVEAINNIQSTYSQLSNVLPSGNRIATHTSGDTTITDINETVTGVVDNNNGTFTYTAENGAETTINVFATLNEYDNKSDASAGGVGSGELFVASQTNSMGAIPGTIIRL